ncbi:MAG: hypothetical protein WCA51_00405 [Dehalococcoidia bacterium]
MTKKNAPLMALIVSLIVLAQLIGGISCQVRKSGPDSLVATEQEAVNARIKWLDEQKFEEPNTPAPLEINVDNVESNTTRIGREGGGVYVDIGVGIGAGGIGVGGVGVGGG